MRLSKFLVKKYRNFGKESKFWLKIEIGLKIFLG